MDESTTDLPHRPSATTGSAFHRLKPAACHNALFNETVVLLDDVIQVE
jgi:hypothetical protein